METTVPLDEEIKNEEIDIDAKASSSLPNSVLGTKRRGELPVDDEEEEIESNSKPAIVGIDKKITMSTDEYIGVLLQNGKDSFFCQGPGCTKQFDSINAYTNHYLQHHMYTCGTCKKQLPGSHLLELHVLETHDTLFSLMAERKPMYSCLAEECPLKFTTSPERFQHVHADHKHHDMMGAFKHFENTCALVKGSGVKKSNNKKHHAGNKKSGKKSAEEMEVEVNPCQGQGEVENEVEKMSEEIMQVEIEKAVKGNSAENKGKSKNKNGNAHPQHPTNPAHITFGHHGSRFQPWHQKSASTTTTSKTTELHSDNGESMNMNAVKESLETEIDK